MALSNLETTFGQFQDLLNSFDSLTSLEELSKANNDSRLLLKSIYNTISELKVQFEDDETELTEILKYEEKYIKMQKEARTLTITTKSRIESLNSAELLKFSKPQNNTNNNTSHDTALKSSLKVTQALQNAVNLMSMELEKSEYSAQMLDSQTSSISKTSSQYSEYQSTLKKSSTVVSYLINKDLRDRILIFAGFIFFLLVVFNIFRRRLWGDKVSVVVSAETPLHTQEIQTPDDPIGTGTMVVPNADEQIVVDFVTGAVEDAWNTFWENADEVVGTLHGEEL